MRYLAILKDSFREALDAKVLYVTLGLTFLVVLLLASLSFRPVTLEEETERILGLSNFLVTGQGIRFEMEDFKQTNLPAKLWDGNYEFVITINYPDEKAVKEEVKGDHQLKPSAFVKELVKEQFWWLENLKVKDLPARHEKERRIEVSSHGTKIDREQSWIHEPTLFFGAWRLSWLRTSLTYGVYWIEEWLVNTIGGWVIALIGVIVTASFLPNMLRKGTVDLVLAKPIRRVSLLLFKFVGGLTFLFLNAAIAIGAVWLVLGLRTGIWNVGFLWSTLIITFFFAILYSVSTLFAVLTRSTVVCIMMTLVAWFFFWLIGLAYDIVTPLSKIQEPAGRPARGKAKGEPGFSLPGWLTTTVTAVYTVTPRTSDMGKLTSKIISEDLLSDAERRERGFAKLEAFPWAESLAVNLGFLALFLGLACWRFSVKDY